MPALPPDVWAELFFDGTWNPITRDVRQTSPITVTRGLSSESSSEAEPTVTECVLDNRHHRYSPRNLRSDLRGKIGRNTPFRWGYKVGPPWATMPGTNGNEITTPTSTAYNVTDIDVRIDLTLEDWTTQQGIAARYTTSGDNRSWAVYLSGTGEIAFAWSPDGTFGALITEFSTVPIVAHNGQRLTLRITLDADNGASGYELRFYIGRTVDDAEWELLGDPIIGGSTTTVFAATSGIEAGDVLGLVIAGMTGKVFALKLMSAILGTAVLSMATADAAPGASSFTSNGAVWTAAGGAVLENKHIRMAGEIPAWPPNRDLSGNDTTTDIAPTGVTRRMDAGNKPQDSALLRYIRAQGPIECWPLTDGVQATSGKSLNGSPDFTVKLNSGTATPTWSDGQLAEWIEPTVLLPTGSDGTIRGSVARAASAASEWSVDFFYNGKQDMDVVIADYGDLTDADPRIAWSIELDQSANEIALFSVSVGETSSSTALQSTVTGAGVFDGKLHHVRLSTSVNGADGDFEIYVDGVLRDSGTATGYASEAVNFIRPGWFYSAITQDTPTIGYITYWGSGAPSAADMWEAATGFPGERAGARIERLATEAGYTASTAGTTGFQELMGVQDRRKLLELMNEASLTNFGYFLDRRDALEVIHRGHSTLWNQQPALTLDFSAGIISAPFRPDDGDKLTENDVSVSRKYGAFPARAVLESGELSVLDFPDGVGRYDNEYEYSLYTDDQAAHVAYMRLNLGTYNGIRYTRITLDLANERVFQMIGDILRADVGDKIRLTNVPEDHGPDDVEILIQGYTEEAGPDTWRITFNGVPAAPWEAFASSVDRYSRADTGGSSLGAALAAGATSVSVATQSGSKRWVDSAAYPAEFPFDVRVGGSGGEVVRVTAISGTSSPQTFTLTRGINGADIGHASGEDVRLAYPVYFPL